MDMGEAFWKANSSYGRKPKFKTPADLLKAACEYFEWVKTNPLYEAKLVAFQGNAKIARLPKMRAMTIIGLCSFLDITVQNWCEYSARENYSDVCMRISNAIKQQKFEGAAAEMLNPSIIARDLGLADKREHAGDGGGPIKVRAENINSKMSAREAANIYTQMLRDDKDE